MNLTTDNITYSIETIQLDQFIVWLVDGGFPGDQDQWDELLLQYTAAINSPEFQKYADSLVRLNLALCKFNLVEVLVKILQVGYIPEYVKELKALGYRGEFNPEKKERYQKELQSVYKQAKILMVEAKQKQDEIEKMFQDKTMSTYTRTYFDENIVILSKFLGYQLKETEITVNKYCIMLKRYIEYTKKN